MSFQGSNAGQGPKRNPPGVAPDPRTATGLQYARGVAPQQQQHDMSTHPSVGRFKNNEVASLYMKGSSAGLNSGGAGQSMATYSNHGLLCQEAPQPTTAGIVDLRTAPAAAAKLNKFSKGKNK